MITILDSSMSLDNIKDRSEGGCGRRRRRRPSSPQCSLALAGSLNLDVQLDPVPEPPILASGRSAGLGERGVRSLVRSSARCVQRNVLLDERLAPQALIALHPSGVASMDQRHSVLQVRSLRVSIASWPARGRSLFELLARLVLVWALAASARRCLARASFQIVRGCAGGSAASCTLTLLSHLADRARACSVCTSL